MIIENNIITSDEGKYLLYKGTPHLSLTLGKLYILEGDKVNLVTISKEDIKEVTPVVVYNDIYYVEATTYPEIVTELIRKKYSLDLELALMANIRIGYSEEEANFLSWRQACKNAAKKFINE